MGLIQSKIGLFFADCMRVILKLSLERGPDTSLFWHVHSIEGKEGGQWGRRSLLF